MRFTEAEVRFISREHATLGLHRFPSVDPATIRGDRAKSMRVVQRVLETRAKVLGPLFTEFQAKAAQPTSDLESTMAAERLF